MLTMLRDRARALKRETTALGLAYRDPRTPWHARLVIACVVAYALSPIDLIHQKDTPGMPGQRRQAPASDG